MNWRRPSARPATPDYAEFDPAEAWPVAFQDCTGLCGKPNQPHEDHGDGMAVCHSCGHPPRA